MATLCKLDFQYTRSGFVKRTQGILETGPWVRLSLYLKIQDLKHQLLALTGLLITRSPTIQLERDIGHFKRRTGPSRLKLYLIDIFYPMSLVSHHLFAMQKKLVKHMVEILNQSVRALFVSHFKQAHWNKSMPRKTTNNDFCIGRPNLCGNPLRQIAMMDTNSHVSSQKCALLLSTGSLQAYGARIS